MTMTREEQIIEAGKIAAEGKEFSVLVNRQHRTMSAYEIGFIEGAQWADSYPNWISVEEELPKEQGKYMFRLSNGDMCYETYYPKLKLLNNVTHWMPIVPPRKEDKQ